MDMPEGTELTKEQMEIQSQTAGAERSFSFKPGGQPSTTQPSAFPWLSPNEVRQNIFPNVLPDIIRAVV